VRGPRMTSIVKVGVIAAAAALASMSLAGCSSGGAGSSGTSSSGTSTATAPPGSSKSFSDGYSAALIGCGFQPNGQPVTNLSTQTCNMIPFMQYPNGDQINVWCQKAVAIGMLSIPSSDNSRQWYAGCEDVVSKAKF